MYCLEWFFWGFLWLTVSLNIYLSLAIFSLSFYFLSSLSLHLFCYRSLLSFSLYFLFINTVANFTTDLHLFSSFFFSCAYENKKIKTDFTIISISLSFLSLNLLLLSFSLFFLSTTSPISQPLCIFFHFPSVVLKKTKPKQSTDFTNVLLRLFLLFIGLVSYANLRILQRRKTKDWC